MAIIKSSTDGNTWTTATVTGTGSVTWATSTVHSLAYAGGVWVAGNNASQVAISTSTNTFNIPQILDIVNTGVTWTTVNSNFGVTIINSVAYGNNLWVAGGSSGQLRTSTDTTNWVTQTSNFGSTIINSVAYGNGLWVAGGSSSQLRTSTDTINWVTRTSNFTGLSAVNSVAYGNGLWVIGGDGGIIRTSTDTINWVTRTSNFGSTNILSVAYGNNLWVAGGLAGQLRTSTDAINWVTRTSNFSVVQRIRSVAYGNGLWVIGGDVTQLRTSTDTINWVTRTSNFGSTNILSVAYSNGLWVAGGDTAIIRTSTDTINWVTQTSNFGTTAIRSVAYGNGLWVAVGPGQIRISPETYSTLSLPNTQISSFNTSFMAVSSNRPRSSTNGITWTTLSGFETVHVNRFIESNGQHILLGNSGALYEKNTLSITWTTRSTGINDNFVNGAVQIDYTRQDNVNTAQTWTTQTSNFGNTNIMSVAYGNGIWAAVGPYGQLRTSTNTVTWITRGPLGNEFIASIAYGNGVWAAGTWNGKFIRVSTDTITWTTNNTNINSNFIGSLAYGNNIWLALTGVNLMRSTDTVTWVTTTTGLFGSGGTNLNYGNGLWIITGYSGQLFRSTNAINWVTSISNVSTHLRNAKYGNGIWIMIGGQNSVFPAPIITSTDAITWVTQTSNFGNTVKPGLAYGNGIWIAASNAIFKTTNGVNWVTTIGNPALFYTNVIYENENWLISGNYGRIITSPQLYNDNYNIVGQNAIYYSTNLVSWTTITTPAASTIKDITSK